MERRLGKEDARISAEEEILSTNSTAQSTKLNCGYSHHIYGAGGDERSGRCYTPRTWKSFSLLVKPSLKKALASAQGRATTPSPFMDLEIRLIPLCPT